MSDEKIVLYDSDQAAHRGVPPEGWISARGNWFGNMPHSEDMARSDGCTHKKCPVCKENVIEKNRWQCSECSAKRIDESFQSLEEVEWCFDSWPVCLCNGEHYFFDEDELEFYIEHHMELGYDCFAVAGLDLVNCKPIFAPELDEDHFELPDEDGDLNRLPSPIYEAVLQYNKAVRECEEPTSWMPGNKRLKVKARP